MVSLRAILLWLMMVAVPFQAFAAAAMVVCAPGSNMSMEIGAGSSAHGHEHDYASLNAVSVDDHVDGQAYAHHGDAADDDHQGAHKCGNCAPCHAVGLTPAIAEIRNHGLPQADLVEPLYALANVSPSVPHKPPRA